MMERKTEQFGDAQRTLSDTERRCDELSSLVFILLDKVNALCAKNDELPFYPYVNFFAATDEELPIFAQGLAHRRECLSHAQPLAKSESL